MKKISILIAIIFISTAASAKDGLKQFYARHHSDKNVQQITLPKLLLYFSGNDHETRAMLRHMKSLKIFEIEGAKHTRTSVQNELQQALETDGFESILQVTESDERVNIYISQDNRFIRKVLICVENNDELVLLQANTKLTLERLTGLVNDVKKSGKGFRIKKES